MRIIKSFIIALAMYSRIPVPRCEWKEEDMKYVFIFFPIVGIVVGALVWGWNYICISFDLPEILRICITAAIPIIITGGIHVDGFMDTMDALHSYRDKEKKLEILKDPHIGAFSVIMLALYGLIYLGALSLIKGIETIAHASIVFVLSRALSGLCAICFKSAREGTLKTFTDSSSKVLVCVILIIEAALCITGMMWINPIMAAGVSVIVLCTVLYYYLKTKKEFGGVTGDTAGYFLLITERNALVVIGILSVLPQIIEKVMK